MQVELWPIDRPIPYARNPRKISAEAIDKVAASLKEFGWQQAIVVDDENVIIAGHTRLLAAQKLGFAEVPVKVAEGLTKTQAKAYRLADNRSGQEAKNDFEMLALELEELKGLDFDLSLTAFDTHEIEPLLAADWNPDKANEDFEDEHQRDEKKDKHGNFVSFTDEQFELVGQAIFKLRDTENEKNISDGRAIELICANFLTDPNFNGSGEELLPQEDDE